MSETKPKGYKYVPSPEGIKRFYANTVGYARTISDMQLHFGEIIDIGEMLTVEERAIVTMNWYDLKVLAALLSAYVTEFERQNGAIKDPILSKPDIFDQVGTEAEQDERFVALPLLTERIQ